MVVVLVEEEGGSNTKDPGTCRRDLRPRASRHTHSLPPSILPAPLPPPLVYLRPFLPSLGIIPGAVAVWGSSWLPAWKGSIGSGVDEEKMEGSMVKRKIDLIYEFSVTFGTHLHIFDFSSRFNN